MLKKIKNIQSARGLRNIDTDNGNDNGEEGGGKKKKKKKGKRSKGRQGP